MSETTIKDSGNRRQFETGAVRDIQEGKGRCDLLPLDVIAELCHGYILGRIYNFTQDGDVCWLYEVLVETMPKFGCYSNMILEVSKHFEEGAKKYGEYNWQKGIPTHCYIDSAIRHLFKWIRKDNDEPHDRAFVWNILCCIWTCQHKPELNDYGKELRNNAHN
jgi:hypothetical protein